MHLKPFILVTCFDENELFGGITEQRKWVKSYV